MDLLEYSSADFTSSVPSTFSDPACVSSQSKFDKLLCKTWRDAENKGYFRYKLDDLQTKILPGKFQYVAQLNIKRAIERRKPQDIMSVSQVFNPAEFNFTKVSQQEILFRIKNADLSDTEETETSLTTVDNICEAAKGTAGLEKKLSNHLMIINVSPLEFCNSLMVPFINSNMPQILTEESIKMAIELVLLSSTPAFRTGFNSLCASASVNHHHFHVYYLQYKLPIETLTVEHLVGDCFVTVGYPAIGFVFQLTNSEVGYLANCLFKVSNYMQSNNIAHNLMITRGVAFGNTDETDYDTIRVYIWARKSIYGIKDDTAFNVACCELSGHLPIKKKDEFDTITEEDVSAVLEDVCLPPFTAVKPEIVKLLG